MFAVTGLAPDAEHLAGAALGPGEPGGSPSGRASPDAGHGHAGISRVPSSPLPLSTTPITKRPSKGAADSNSRSVGELRGSSA
jgi:hypothetical protein